LKPAPHLQLRAVLRPAMDAFVAGAAIAARALGYHGLGNIIVEQRLGPERIALLFALSASKTRGRDLAVIITTGAIARFNAQPCGWSGEVEEAIAREALSRDAAMREKLSHYGSSVPPRLGFAELTKSATVMVKECWPEIERLTAT
jgi:hypothetical protein